MPNSGSVNISRSGQGRLSPTSLLRTIRIILNDSRWAIYYKDPHRANDDWDARRATAGSMKLRCQLRSAQTTQP